MRFLLVFVPGTLLGSLLFSLVLGWFGFRNITSNRIHDEFQTKLGRVFDRLVQFKGREGRWPESLEELVPGWEDWPGDGAPGLDPWGRPYLFRATEQGPEVSTLGSDGLPGGHDDAADLRFGAGGWDRRSYNARPGPLEYVGTRIFQVAVDSGLILWAVTVLVYFGSRLFHRPILPKPGSGEFRDALVGVSIIWSTGALILFLHLDLVFSGPSGH